MNQIKDSIEAPITSLADEDIMQGYDEEDAEVEQPQNNESMNHFYNINRFVIVAIGAFSAFLGIGLVLGIPMSPASVRSLQSNDCSDTNWYWHPDERKCTRGKGALGISFSELSACCKQAFGENGCDWHDECYDISSEEHYVFDEASDGPVEVTDKTFFKFYDNEMAATDSIISEKGATLSKSSKSMNQPSGAKSGKSSGSKSSKVAQLYINENLDTGDAVTVYEAGPIKIEAGCGNSTNSICNNIIARDDDDDDGVEIQEACLILTLFDADEDLLVFGDAAKDSGLNEPPIGDTLPQVLDAGVTYTTELWDVTRSTNDIDEGGVWANGFYVGWDGESFIGVRSDNELGVIGGNCQIAGVFNYVIP